MRSRKAALELEEKKLCKQKELFEKQWQLLESELRKVARDKQLLEKEKENLKKQQGQARSTVYTANTKFFTGVRTAVNLKKRYRELLKIYHPDNESGDENMVLQINQEYKVLKRQYGID